MSARALVGAAFALGILAGCNGGGAGATPSASAQRSAAATAPSGWAPTSSATLPNAPLPTSVHRTKDPESLFRADTDACNAGDKAGCERLAERYGGVGHEAGCGVPRHRAFPFVKRAAEDAENDEPAYAHALAKACTLGDTDACARADAAEVTRGKSPIHKRFSGMRLPTDRLGIWVFREVDPKAKKILDERRAGCLEPPFACAPPDTTLFKDEPAPKGGKLAPEIEARAIDACKRTHDCNDIYMTLDKDGYLPAALAHLRAAFETTVADACLAGECTCSDALRYLPEGDAARFDYAVLGCENGEADACHELGSFYVRGEHVPKDQEMAHAIEDVVCPPIHASDDPGEYSPMACDALAAHYREGAYPGKDWERAMYYASFACLRPGYEWDHAPCMRLGTFWAEKRTVTLSEGQNWRNATAAAYGSEPDFNHECTRGSVVDACAAFSKLEGTAK